MKYTVIDVLEGYLEIGCCDTIKECKKIAREFDEDTDGECCIIVFENKKQIKFTY